MIRFRDLSSTCCRRSSLSVSASSSFLIFVFIFALVRPSPPVLCQNIFSSFFRTNNYNRYVKNPIYNRNLVPSSNTGSWGDMVGEYSQISTSASSQQQQQQQHPQNRQHHSSKNLNTEFHLPPLNYGHIPNTINGIDFASSASVSASVHRNPGGAQRSQHHHQQGASNKFEGRARNVDDTLSMGVNRYQNAYSAPQASPQPASELPIRESSVKSRINSKKLFETKKTVVSAPNGNGNLKNKYNSFDSDLYNLEDNLDNSLGSSYDSKEIDIKHPEPVYNHQPSTSGSDSNKYNQEKALNLKLEYGFKPLPPGQSSLQNHLMHPNVKSIFATSAPAPLRQYPVYSSSSTTTSTTSTTSSSPPPTTTTTTTTTTEEATTMNQDDIYPIFEEDSEKHQFADADFEPEAESSGHNNIYSYPKQQSQERKSKVLEQNSSDRYYSGDFRKLVHSPMEGEQSDLHRLAFAGIESFKPDVDSPIRSSLDTIIGAHFLNFNSLANYPDITHFKTNGLDCAKNGQYCEYDSSYPKDYITSKIRNCSDVLDAMYTELPESHSDFNGYRPFIKIHSLPSSRKKNVSICDSERKYIRPSVIQDINGEFLLILQSSYYFQQVPIETCTAPSKPCNLESCSASVRCVQKYRTQVLISMEHHDPGSEAEEMSCPRMRLFRLPSNCVCELA